MIVHPIIQSVSLTEVIPPSQSAWRRTPKNIVKLATELSALERMMAGKGYGAAEFEALLVDEKVLIFFQKMG